LLRAGYIVLFPDSLSPRGLRELCTIRAGERPVDPARRRLDALGALRWLASQPGVARNRIALMGWSHGGTTALATIDAAHREVLRFRRTDDSMPFFRAAIAFYPGCTPALRDHEWTPAVPTRILIGASDDWTPAKPCEDLAARARERRWPLETTVYAGAHHGFDAPRGKVVHRLDVPNGVNPGQGVHVGPDPEARRDANRIVAEFLRALLTE
jgi:dienelactone hydrolase